MFSVEFVCLACFDLFYHVEIVLAKYDVRKRVCCSLSQVGYFVDELIEDFLCLKGQFILLVGLILHNFLQFLILEEIHTKLMLGFTLAFFPATNRRILLTLFRATNQDGLLALNAL